MSTKNVQKRDKLNRLLREWPFGVVKTQSELEQRGISRQLSRLYVKNGWLEKVGQGAFQRAGDKIGWQGGLYALQQKGYRLHVGGKTALDLKGSGHFVPLSEQRKIYLYSDGVNAKHPLPKWFVTGFQGMTVDYYPRSLFGKALGLEELSESAFPVLGSSLERALMEVLALVPKQLSYSHAHLLFQGKENLRPQLVQLLLEASLSYKVKRLFLHLSNKCCLPWFSRLKLDAIDLGQGKRQIGAGGEYDVTYKISVPKLNIFEDENKDIEV